MRVKSRETLRQMIRRKFPHHKCVVISNREPYVHVLRRRRLEWVRPASGVTTALDPLMRASRGLWVAHGSGSGDRRASDRRGFVAVPPNRPAYRLKRVWLNSELEENYYYGFANSALWPLCHVVYRKPEFRLKHWQAYREVNRIFADAVAREVGDSRALLFIQDYHFALLPRMLRERCPRALIAQFWHIPWPNPEVFRICPWKHEILEGLLGNDVLGFHLRYHGDNFMATVDRELAVRLDRERVAVAANGHLTKIRAFPISIDFEEISHRSASPETHKLAEKLRRKYRIGPPQVLGVGVDRLDYTKGIPERLEALDVFFRRYPQYIGRLVFLQAGVPSRTHIASYQRLNEEIESRVRALNRKYRRGRWRPVIFVREHLDLPTLLALYRTARFLLVTSLHDGMNLVAKEFVASQVDANGVLILSRFTGAARELDDALLINPYAPDEVAERIREAVEMDPIEVRRRMGRLRALLRERNIYGWAAAILDKLAKLA